MITTVDAVRMDEIELRDQLNKHNLPVSGDKSELLIRLVEHLDSKISGKTGKASIVKPATKAISTQPLTVNVEADLIAKRKAKFGAVEGFGLDDD